MSYYGKKSQQKTRENRKSVADHRLTKYERQELQRKNRINHAVIQADKESAGVQPIEYRTQAHNRKHGEQTIDEERAVHEELMSGQLSAWRKLLPQLLARLKKIPDPRNVRKIRHQLDVIFLYGLFASIFHIRSRRELNEKLTTACFVESLSAMFPEINTTPHADTIARLLEKIDPKDIESALIYMVKKVINHKKFRRLLFKNMLSISIDGTQKATRNGQQETEGWLLRKFKKSGSVMFQQYVYVLEANITLPGNIQIPLLTEFCAGGEDCDLDPGSKQDCELKAFTRLTERLKRYFPRKKIIVILDSLYACQSVIGTLKANAWEFMIKLPKKLKSLYAKLADAITSRQSLANIPYHREREQKFYWVNDVHYNGHAIHLVGCNENWKENAPELGKIIHQHSIHTWISSIPLSSYNLHVLCNDLARNRALIEDSNNSEKNRGYQYEHIFSYDWNAMQGFHYLMRVAHAINEISSFAKTVKKFIKNIGIKNTINRLLRIMANPWLDKIWIANELKKPIRLFLIL